VEVREALLMDGVELEWRGAFTSGEVNMLHAAAFHTRVYSDEEWDWAALAARWSLGWCTARVDGELVGFVNVLTDGLVHAWLQDVMVSPLHRRLGIGRRLVALAVEQCREAGCEWLHVDYDDDAIEFYERTCGFQPTNGGLRALR
jgi:ribosomal protein S18 acetylase RimI-like enzyme